jgi:hypothetical protein
MGIKNPSFRTDFKNVHMPLVKSAPKKSFLLLRLFYRKNAWVLQKIFLKIIQKNNMYECWKQSGDGRCWQNQIQPLVGDSPAVVAAAVLSPAVAAAAAAVRPPARKSVSLMTLVTAILVAKAVVAASTLFKKSFSQKTILPIEVLKKSVFWAKLFWVHF